jgi:hypothetical protein
MTTALALALNGAFAVIVFSLIYLLLGRAIHLGQRDSRAQARPLALGDPFAVATLRRPDAIERPGTIERRAA